MTTKKSSDKQLMGIAAGRTLDGQIEDVRKYGDHCTTPVIRARLLQALGLPEPKPMAENLLIFGCYTPFFFPFVLRDYIKLLDILGVNYTYSLDAVCCGAPIILASPRTQQEQAIQVSKESAQKNRDLAQRMRASTIVYCCPGCARMDKGFFPDEAERHVYILDLITDRLEKETLQVAPTIVGFFGGCQTRYSAIFQDAKLRVDRYRQLMDRIEGLKIIDLPQDICCGKYSERLVQEAQKQNLDTIVCPCNGCFGEIGNTAKGRVQVKHLAEILLRALGR